LKWALKRREQSSLSQKPAGVGDYVSISSLQQKPFNVANMLTFSTVQGALEWLETNQDKSLDEIKAAATTSADNDDGPPLQPGEEPRSLVCNECGKKFRSHAQAEYHASKTEHVDFSESTEEVAPLTEEEKKAKLDALREKLASKRATQSEQDKIDKKRNDVNLSLRCHVGPC
jgi:hypothetical protein